MEAALLASLGVQVVDERVHAARVVAAVQAQSDGTGESIFDLLPFIPEGVSAESVCSTARALTSALKRAPPGAARAELRLELQMALALVSEMGADVEVSERDSQVWSAASVQMDVAALIGAQAASIAPPPATSASAAAAAAAATKVLERRRRRERERKLRATSSDALGILLQSGSTRHSADEHRATATDEISEPSSSGAVKRRPAAPRAAERKRPLRHPNPSGGGGATSRVVLRRKPSGGWCASPSGRAKAPQLTGEGGSAAASIRSAASASASARTGQACPICKRPLPPGATANFINRHVDRCLKSSRTKRSVGSKRTRRAAGGASSSSSATAARSAAASLLRSAKIAARAAADADAIGFDDETTSEEEAVELIRRRSAAAALDDDDDDDDADDDDSDSSGLISTPDGIPDDWSTRVYRARVGKHHAAMKIRAAARATAAAAAGDTAASDDDEGKDRVLERCDRAGRSLKVPGYIYEKLFPYQVRFAVAFAVVVLRVRLRPPHIVMIASCATRCAHSHVVLTAAFLSCAISRVHCDLLVRMQSIRAQLPACCCGMVLEAALRERRGYPWRRDGSR
jgi:hypothetical protein